MPEELRAGTSWPALHRTGPGPTGALVGLTGVAAFVVAALALHALRADLDWRTTPLSFYLLGPPGHWLQAGYVALSLGIAGLAIASYRDAAPAARSAAPLFLFLVAAVALTVTALAPTNVPGRDATFAGFVHNIAAGTTFLCVTTAMLLQAWRWRGDPRARADFAFGFALALVAFTALWVHTLYRGFPHGVSQRVVIVLVLWWLAWASLRLLRRP